ncbi:MAG: alpha/beta hydrolase [Bryobacteraceae bacterium]
MQLKTTLAFAFGTAALVTTLIAQGTTENIRVVNVAQKGNPPTGPNQVVIEHDQGLKTHTIYRPASLTAAKYPLLVWGEGGCAKNGLTFPEYLSEIASYGFVIVADGPPVENTGAKGGPGGPGGAKGPAPDAAAKGKAGPPAGAAAAKGKGGAPAGAGNMTDGSALIAAIDWMEKETKDSKSRFYQKVDTGHTAAMGMSCGGLMSYGASNDPRIATVGIWNSGLFDKDQKIIGAIHSPVIIITGGESDIAYANGKSDYEVMPPRVPIFYGVFPSVGHGGTYNLDNGGPFGQVAVAWLKWQLQGDTSAKGKGYFVGDKCTLCTDSGWQVQSRSLR